MRCRVVSLSGQELLSIEVDPDTSLRLVWEALPPPPSPAWRQLLHGGAVVKPYSTAAQLADASEAGLESASTIEVTVVDCQPRRILSNGNDGLCVWCRETGQRIGTMAFPDTSGIPRATASPDGKEVLVVTGGAARIFDLRTGNERVCLRGHWASPTSAMYACSGEVAVTSSWDCTAKIWDCRTGCCVQTLQGHTLPVRCASFSPCCLSVLTASLDGIARVWRASTGFLQMVFRDREHALEYATYSPDGSLVATTSGSEFFLGKGPGFAHVWCARGGDRLHVFKERAHAERVAFAPDSLSVVVPYMDGTVRVWCIRSGDCTLSIDCHDAYVSSATFSKDGSEILTASGDCTVKVWDAFTGACVVVLRGTASVRFVEYLPA